MNTCTLFIVWASTLFLRQTTNLVTGQQLAPAACPGTDCPKNPCASAGLDCCRCKYPSSTTSVQVCACCPAGYFCCPATIFSSQPKCCPKQSTCDLFGCKPLNVKPLQTEPACAPCGPLIFTVSSVDFVKELYLDGVSYTDSLLPTTSASVSSLEIPADTTTIAVVASAASTSAFAGLVASATTDFLLTGTNWKCISQNLTGWSHPSFDDSSWPSAVSLGVNTGRDRRYFRPTISSNASWIWTANNQNPKLDSTIFCRAPIFPWNCNVGFGNCPANLCALQNKQCCYCEFVALGSTRVCHCCPQGYHCCSDGAGGKVCCPNNTVCGPHGTCQLPIMYRQVSAQFNCSSC